MEISLLDKKYISIFEKQKTIDYDLCLRNFKSTNIYTIPLLKKYNNFNTIKFNLKFPGSYRDKNGIHLSLKFHKFINFINFDYLISIHTIDPVIHFPIKSNYGISDITFVCLDDQNKNSPEFYFDNISCEASDIINIKYTNKISALVGMANRRFSEVIGKKFLNYNSNNNKHFIYKFLLICIL